MRFGHWKNTSGRGAPHECPSIPWNDRSKGFLILTGVEPPAMNFRSGRRWLLAAIAIVLIVGITAPVAVFVQASSSSQSQLAALITAAESSRSYAASTVDYAAADGLSVSSAQAQLSQGDSLLAAAQTDLQSETNLGAGIQAVQTAMSDYAAAATSTSIALSSAGLTASVDYYAALSAVTEVNATVNIVASIAAQACASSATAGAALQAFAQACSQVNAQVTSARAYLNQAAGLLVQSGGHIATSAVVSQALSLVAEGRADAQACQSLMLTIASYTYSQRGQAYISAVVDPLYADANATMASEQSLIANLTGYQNGWSAYAQSQASDTAGVSSSASALGTAISQVSPGAVSASISAASATAGDVSADMSALLNIAGILTFSNLVSAIQASATATTSYSDALVSASTWSGAYTGTQLSAFSSYLSTGNSDAAEVQSSGSAYVSDYQSVVADLSSYQSILPALQTIYNDLTGLQVSSTVSGANAALTQETNAMTTVQSDISSMNTTVSSGEAAVLVSSNLLATASVVSMAGGSYLNATAKSALAQVSASASATAQSAQSFVTSALACLQASVGTYSSAVTALTASGASLATQTQGSTSAAATALIYVQSDSHIRTAAVAAGQADIVEVFQLFTTQNVSAGIAAMAQASVEFQAASGSAA
jgi:trimeric autotransporter adhesin